MSATRTDRSTARLRGIALCCPRDGVELADHGAALRCPACRTDYPVVDGVPVLVDDDTSVFRRADYVAQGGYRGASYGRAEDRETGWRRRARALARRLRDGKGGIHHPSQEDAIRWVAALRPRPRVLVVGMGGWRLGEGVAEMVYTDVAFCDGLDAIADAHALPFPDGSFDLVIACAVLEHVADPQRCVAEMTRVLGAGGFAYAVTPFLQPVHMGAYDFTRWTPIGHRRLFRQFDEVAAGVALGPGAALGFVLAEALPALSARPPLRRLARAGALLLALPLKRLDAVLADRGDAAAGCWFLGRRRDGAPVPDRDLVQSYREGFGRSPPALPDPEAFR